MNRALAYLSLAVAVSACTDNSITVPSADPSAVVADVRSGTATVRSDADAGAGSFRAAVEAANADASITRIVFLGHVGRVMLATPVEFSGAQSMTIDGHHSVLDGAALAGLGDAFRATGGGDLTLQRLSVEAAPGNGIAVEIPATATGTINVALTDLAITGNRGHGVVINDQEAPEEAGNPDVTPQIRPNENGSAASLHVTVTRSRFIGNGFGALDRDGLRINEGGDGSLVTEIKWTTAAGNGADGIELDERGAGDVQFDIFASAFTRNGSFDTSEDPDLDDGIDVDETGAGHLIGTVVLTTANDNYEEGFDFNENDAGDFRVDMKRVEASRNGEEGIDFEEDDDFAGGGDLITTLTHITADGNGGGDAGLKIREKGTGNLSASVAHLRTSDNLASGTQIREDAAGTLVAEVVHAVASGNTSDGIDFDENGTGDVSATVAHSKALDNARFGVRADNQSPGVGTLVLRDVVLMGNGSAPTGGNATVTLTPQ